jgi:uncharacterized protein YcnI
MNLDTQSRNFRKYICTSASVAMAIVALGSTPASAHMGIFPSPDATGSTTNPLTHDKSGYLNLRIGHGCTDETETLSKLDGSALKGQVLGTHSVSVIVPLVAQGSGSTVPKPAYVPGWTSRTVKNVDGTYTITWTAKDSTFDVPADSAEAGDLVSQPYGIFGVSIKWAAGASGVTYFSGEQVCLQDVSGIPAIKSAHKVALSKSGSKALVTFRGPKAMAGQVLNLKVDGVTIATATLDKKGNARVKASKANSKLIQKKGALIAFTDASGVVQGWTGGQAATRELKIEWNKQAASQTATYSDDKTIEYNQAPSVTVL